MNLWDIFVLSRSRGVVNNFRAAGLTQAWNINQSISCAIVLRRLFLANWVQLGSNSWKCSSVIDQNELWKNKITLVLPNKGKPKFQASPYSGAFENFEIQASPYSGAFRNFEIQASPYSGAFRLPLIRELLKISKIRLPLIREKQCNKMNEK